MSSIDDRIVEMTFDNSSFERGVSTTLSSLDKLKQSLTMSGASKGLDEVQASASKFSVSGMVDGVSEVSKGFIALGTIAITTLANITNKAVDAGLQLAKSLTIDPIVQGFTEYETTLNSIQTILANTGLKGAKGLAEVNGALNQLNHYADKTIYNFSQMARNIGTFTAAGVKLDTSVAAIKGIANLAAISGSSADQASTAMYQLSQALASGTVKLMDWNSVVNAGMGGKVFQDALKETARNMGTDIDSIIKKAGSFRDSLQTGWLTSDVLTQTLAKFTGDLTAAQLKAQGYNKQQIKSIIELGKTASDAATKVKTATQLVSTLQEAVGSGWTKTFTIIVGNFNEAKNLFTGVSNSLGGMIQASAKARNKVLQDWKNLGGRDLLIQGISDAFKALMQIIAPVKKAFHDIFPPATGKTLLKITKAFADFAKSLQISKDTSNDLRRTFRGLFAVVDILWQVIKGVLGVIGDLFSTVGKGSGSFLDLTANIGDFLTHLDEAIKKGGFLNNFFDGLSTVLRIPLKLLGVIGTLIGNLFTGFDSTSLDGAIQGVGKALSPLERIINAVTTAWQGLMDILGHVGDFLQPFVASIVDMFKGLGDAITQGLSTGNFKGVLDVINTALLGGILVLVKRFFDRGLSSTFDGGLVNTIKGSFTQLTNTMKAMQTQIQAKTLLTIAGAIALLTASVVALSLIDSAKLTKALAAMATGFGELLGSMAILTKISSTAGFVKIPLIAGSMVALATAVLILSGALAILAQLDWNQLAKGLTGVGALLALIALTAKVLQGSSKGLISAGLAMIPLAIGLTILAGAVKLFSLMSWDDLAKGMVGVAGGLLLIAGATKLMPASLPLTAAGLVLVGVSLQLIASAMAIFGTMDWSTIGKGLAALAGSLIIIAIAMNLMPGPAMVLTAAGLVLVGIALTEIAGALKIMGSMSWSSIAKGLVTLAGALLILAAGLYLMSGSIAGAAALLVTAAALAVLTPVLVTLGALSWTAILKGLTALAGVFVVLGLAGLILAPLVPVLLGLGAALLLVGAGMALLGAGALGLATALSIFVAVGTAGIAVVQGYIGLIPQLMTEVAKGLIAFLKTLIKGSDQITKAFSSLLGDLLDAVKKNVPKMADLFDTLVKTAIKVIKNDVPLMIQAGIDIIMAFLRGIRNNIGEIVNIAVSIITNFIRAVGKQAPRIADAAYKAIIDFINGLSDAIDANSGPLGEAGGRLAVSIVEGLIAGLEGAVSQVVTAAENLAKSAIDAAKGALHINSPSKDFIKIGESTGEGMVMGIDAMGNATKKSAEAMGKGTIDVITKTMSKIPQFIDSNVDFSPTITPVLDLTQAVKDATTLNALVKPVVTAGVSFDTASSISAMTEAARNAPTTESTTPLEPKEIKFEQNNYSPKALDPGTVYRNTKNQLALAKEALDA